MLLVSYDAKLRLENVCRTKFSWDCLLWRNVTFWSVLWHSSEILVHIQQGWHAVIQCTSNTKMSLDLNSSGEKYCYTLQTAYIAQKVQEIDLQGRLFIFFAATQH